MFLVYGSSLTDDQEELVFQFVWKLDEAELQASTPSCYFVILAGEHYFAEFFHLFVGIFIRSTATETVQFLIVLIFHFLAYGSQQAVFFTSFVLSATFFFHFHNGWNFL